jgi:hypothetical protein
MSVKSVHFFIRPGTMNKFNLIQDLINLAILITFLSVHMCFLSLFKLLNMFVCNVKMFVNSCNVFYICKYCQ